MAEIIQETVATNVNPKRPTVITPPVVQTSSSQTVEYIIYFIFSVLDILLGFRLILRLLGAGTRSVFVDSIYTVTGIFTWPFVGIFSQGAAPGLETTSVFEPATLIAMIVYAILAWGVIWLFRIISRREPLSTE